MEPLFIFILFGTVMLALIIFGHQRARARSAAIAGWAAAKGFYFHPGKARNFDDQHPMLSYLRRGGSRYAYNIASGQWGDVTFTSFDYHYSTGSGKNRKTHRFSAVLLKPAHEMKALLVRPEGFFDKVKAGFGFNDIDFESAEFSKKFYVSANDKRWAYDVIHQRTMQFIMMNSLSHQKFSFECNHEVMCVVSKRVLEIPGFEAAYEFGNTILAEIPEYVRQKL
ncbi:MAG: hypothetical protein ACI8XO_000876 [Verrucomicrobiales bacterium]|jgi:hypothetical protein